MAKSKQEVYERLKDMIIFCEYPPGTSLSERVLAEELGISRTPLREILQRLSYQRLVDIQPRKGIFVSPVDYFIIRSVFETRIPLEMTAVSLAVSKARPEDIKTLEGIVDQSRLVSERGDRRKLIRLDRAFHAEIGRISQNPVLSEMLEDLHNVCLRFWFLSDELSMNYRNVEEHENIVAAIRKGDPKGAARSQAEHLLNFLALFGDEARNLLQTVLPGLSSDTE